jgi:hypothetical protein
MSYILIPVVILLIGAVLSGLKSKGKDKKVFPYALNQTLLTKRELEFFNMLRPIAEAHGLYVAVKPRLADFINVSVKQFDKGSGYCTYLNKITSKHIDFLLINKDANPSMGFELDDSTHSLPDRVRRDDFVNDVYYTIRLDVHRSTTFSNEWIESCILESLKRTPTGSKNWPRPSPSLS